MISIEAAAAAALFGANIARPLQYRICMLVCGETCSLRNVKGLGPDEAEREGARDGFSTQEMAPKSCHRRFVGNLHSAVS